MKMKIEQPNIFALFEILRDVIKFQYKEMKECGSKTQLDNTKIILKDLQTYSKDMNQHESLTKQVSGVKNFLDSIKNIHILFDQSQSNLRDIMNEGLK